MDECDEAGMDSSGTLTAPLWAFERGKGYKFVVEHIEVTLAGGGRCQLDLTAPALKCISDAIEGVIERGV